MSLSHSTQRAFLDAALEAVEVRVAAASSSSPDFADADASMLAAVGVVRRRAQEGAIVPFLWLGERLRLTQTEQLVLWLLIGHQLSPSIRTSLRSLSTEEVADPTSDAVRRVVYGDGNRRLAELELGAEGRLLKLGLVERTDGAERCPAYRQTLAASSRILALALGSEERDPAIESMRCRRESVSCELVLPEHLERELQKALATPQLILLHGAVGTGRRSALRAQLTATGRTSIEVDCNYLDADPRVAQRQLQVLGRECKLLESVPLLVDLHAFAQHEARAELLALVETELDGLVLATSRHIFPHRWRRAPKSIEVRSISSSDRARLWSRVVPSLNERDAGIVAALYPLSPALVVRSGEAVERARGEEALKAEHISTGVRAIVDNSLLGLASRIETKQGWNDLVLPQDQQLALEELIARIRQRSLVYDDWGFAAKVGKGLGVTALFSGPPGTGKSMAACLVARELGVDVYQVDLSKIVSKFIGETERNLAQLFDAAEAGHAILLFDEADALFGKRTEVRSSNDRHANQEVNYLLQRLESFSGICILTSNHEAAIDEAFRRRLSTHIRFPVPEEKERRRLWHAMLPEKAPCAGDLHLEDLASAFAMSGGYIRNAALRAAFLAADRATEITAELLAEAAQLEYDALGKLTTFSREA